MTAIAAPQLFGGNMLVDEPVDAIQDQTQRVVVG